MMMCKNPRWPRLFTRAIFGCRRNLIDHCKGSNFCILGKRTTDALLERSVRLRPSGQTPRPGSIKARGLGHCVEPRLLLD